MGEYWDQLGEDENEMTPEERRAAAKAGIAKGPSVEDWIANAKFHTLVERDGKSFELLQQKSELFKQTGNLVIPPEFKEWVEMPVVLEFTNGEEAEAKMEEPVPQAA